MVGTVRRTLQAIAAGTVMVAAAHAASPGATAPGRDPDAIALLPPPDLPQRALVAAKLYWAVTTFFAHGEALSAGYNFEAEFRRFLDEALAARTRLGFDRAAMRLMGSLRNGHTDFTDDVMRAEPPLPFRLQRLDGGWTVVASRLAGLDPGDAVATLDGHPFEDWVSANIPLVGRSNRAESESSLMGTSFLWPARFRLGLADGRGMAVDRAKPAGAPWRGAVWPTAVGVTDPAPGVVRIAIPGFDDPALERAALDAVRRHAGARAILFDVRGNGGGSTPVHLLRALIDVPYRDMVDATPLHVGTIEAWAAGGDAILSNAMVRSGGELIPPDHPLFHGRVLVLIDRYCASACEDFVLALHEAHRATILGETTYGSTGQPFSVAFPELGMSLRVGTRREYLPGLLPFEGVGVAPDIAVPLTADALRAGRDDALRRTLEIAGGSG